MGLGILGGPSAIGSLGYDDFREEVQASYLEEAWKEGQVSEASLFPWLKVSVETKTQQQILNSFLAFKGYATITADGKVGPATCAAMKLAATIGGGHLAPFGTCQSFGTPPKCVKPPCPTGAGVPSASAVVITPPPPISLPRTSPVPAAVKPAPAPAYAPPVAAKPKMSTANMLMVGGLVAGVATVGYFVAKKKGWVKG